MPGAVHLAIDGNQRQFSELDLRVMQKHTWQPTLERVLSKCHIPFNIVVLNGQHHKKCEFVFPRSQSISEREKLKTKIETALATYGVELQDKDNRVNVILTANSGPNIIAMTPWITMHRVAHAIQFVSSNFQPAIICRLMSNHIKLQQAIGTIAKPSKTKNYEYNFYNESLAKLIGDTRCLRTGNHLNGNDIIFPADLTAEIWTEYFFKGRMTVKIDAAKEKFQKVSDTDYYKDFIDNLEALEPFLMNELNTHTQKAIGNYVSF